MRKVIDKVQTIGAATALALVTLLDGFLQIGDGLKPECSGGVGTPPFIITPLLCFALSGFSVVPSGPISHTLM
jgi:hypothetical protein